MCNDNNAYIRTCSKAGESQDINTGEMEMDSQCQAHIQLVQKSQHTCTDSQAFGPRRADDSGNRWKRQHDHWQSPPVRNIRDFPISQHLLCMIHCCLSEHWHEWSGVGGHWGDSESWGSIARGSKSQGLHTMWLSVPSPFSNFEITYFAVGWVGGEYHFKQLHHQIPGGQ